MIKILTALEAGKAIPKECEQSVVNQTVPTVRYICDKFARTDDGMQAHIESQVKNFNWLMQGITASDGHVLIMDADVCLPLRDDLDYMSKFLDAHPELDACTYDTKNVLNIKKMRKYYHVVIACCLVRAEKLVGYEFKVGQLVCHCIDFNNTFKNDYIDGRKLKEIK